ncbi:MAG: hypothetical protein R3319_02535 [Candidatus Bathyarchaeia archaeon]|nr:hypothetical protein [Candidatus Bathyarchaeia archaeon]
MQADHRTIIADTPPNSNLNAIPHDRNVVHSFQQETIAELTELASKLANRHAEARAGSHKQRRTVTQIYEAMC